MGDKLFAVKLTDGSVVLTTSEGWRKMHVTGTPVFTKVIDGKPAVISQFEAAQAGVLEARGEYTPRPPSLFTGTMAASTRKSTPFREPSKSFEKYRQIKPHSPEPLSTISMKVDMRTRYVLVHSLRADYVKGKGL